MGIRQTTIAIVDISTTDYESSFPNHLATPPRESLLQSMHQIGILSPIWVTPTSTGYKLLDGYQRLTHCPSTHILASLIPASEFEQYTLMLEAHAEKLSRSVMQKVLFLLNWKSTTASLADHCAPLGLQHYNAMLVHSKKIAQLPKTIQTRCHQHALSFAVCLRLASYTQELLHTLETSVASIHVSSSNWLRIADQLHDLSKRHNTPASAILAEPDTQHIFKTQGASALIQHLSNQVQPTVHTVNAQLTQLSQTAPDGIQIQWDRSLENRQLALHCTLRDPHELNHLSQQLQKSEPVVSSMMALL